MVQSLADLLKHTRLTINQTQKQVAESIGVDVCTYRLWEWGKTMPNPKLWLKIKEFVNNEKLNEIFEQLNQKPYTLKMVASELGVSHWTIIDWIEKGKIPKPDKNIFNREFVFSDLNIQEIKAKTSNL